jgi:hypothetical protein
MSERAPIALMLGGSRWQSDIIRRASEMGLRTLVADISSRAPSRGLAERVHSNRYQRPGGTAPVGANARRPTRYC